MHVVRPTDSSGQRLEPVIQVEVSLSEAGRRDALAHCQPTAPRFSAWLTPDDPNWVRIAGLVTHFPHEPVLGEEVPTLVLNAPFQVILFGQEPHAQSDSDEVLWHRPHATIVWGSDPEPLDTFAGSDAVAAVAEEQWARARASVEAADSDLAELLPDWTRWMRRFLTSVGEELAAWRPPEKAYDLPRDVTRDLFPSKVAELVRRLLALDLEEADPELAGELTEDLFAERQKFQHAMGRLETFRTEMAEAEAWVSQHGSSRLRKALAQRLLHRTLSVYRTERLERERPGWAWLTDDGLGSVRDVLNPTEEALDALELARATSQTAELFFRQPKGERGEMWLRDKFLGRRIAIPVSDLAKLGEKSL